MYEGVDAMWCVRLFQMWAALVATAVGGTVEYPKVGRHTSRQPTDTPTLSTDITGRQCRVMSAVVFWRPTVVALCWFVLTGDGRHVWRCRSCQATRANTTRRDRTLSADIVGS